LDVQIGDVQIGYVPPLYMKAIVGAELRGEDEDRVENRRICRIWMHTPVLGISSQYVRISYIYIDLVQFNSILCLCHLSQAVK
jgi:hypothetical protein